MVGFRSAIPTLPQIMEFGAAMRSRRLQHDDDPVLACCISNVMRKWPCCKDRQGGRSKPTAAWIQAMRTEIRRPSSSMRLRP